MMRPAPLPITSLARLAAFCDALIEAVWLAAICVIPLLLHPQSPEAAYQPFKYGFLRALALLGAAAWVVRAVSQRRPGLGLSADRFKSFRSPLAILFLLFALIVAASTVFSIYPAVSFWGAHETFQGALTYAAELFLTALIAFHLRTSDQVERLVTTLLVTSFAVSIFAILQRFGWDPRHPQIVQSRVFATAGHPIYLAGYLLMSMPLALYRLLSWRARPRSERAPLTAFVFYGALLVTQLIAFFCAQSRGPILALGATLFTFGILYAACRRRKYAVAFGGAVALLLAATILFGGGAMKSLGQVPGLKRFALTQPGRGLEFFRADIWKQAPNITLARKPLPHPSGGVDRWHALRPWFGYGPETLDCVLPIYYTVPNNPDYVIENRFHDLVWDLWFSLGVAGLCIFLGIILWLFLCAWRRLGFFQAGVGGPGFWIISAVSLLAGLAIFAGIFGIGFAGVGLVAGLIGGQLAFVGFSLFRGEGEAHLSRSRLLLLALLAAIAGHLVDTAFAFPSAPTAVLFWSYLGVAIALLRGTGEKMDEASAPAKASDGSRGSSGSVFFAGMLSSLGLVTFLSSALHQYSYQAITFSDVLSRSLFNPGGSGNSYSLLLLAGMALWIGFAFAFALDARLAFGKRNFSANVAWTLLLAAGVGLAAALIVSGQIAGIGPFPGISAPESAILQQAQGYDYLLVGEITALLLFTVAVAWSLRDNSPAAFSATPRAGWIALPLVAAIFFIALRGVALNPLRAEVYAAWGMALDGAKRAPLSPPSYRRAIAIDPRTFIYRARLRSALISQAGTTMDRVLARSYFAEAERALLAFREISDLNRGSLYLGQLYLIWAEREEGATKANLEERAAQVLREACAFEPDNEPVAALSAAVQKHISERPRQP